MKQIAVYTIILSGKKPGTYSFNFEISDVFFANFPYSLIQSGQLIAKVILEKHENKMIFDVKISGTVSQNCDRCLEPINWPITIDKQLFVDLSESPIETDDDDAIQIHANTPKFDLAPYFYEYITTSLPLKISCDKIDQKACDKIMLEKLSQVSATIKNSEKIVDPRWEKLNKLKFN